MDTHKHSAVNGNTCSLKRCMRVSCPYTIKPLNKPYPELAIFIFQNEYLESP